jgi:multiple sugar transport system permease protein
MGLILPYTAVYMPVPLFILYATFMKIPTTIEESAYLDGANRLTIFTRLFLPLGRAGLVSAVIISFINCWGEFLFALTLTSNLKSTTLSIGILLVNYEEQSWSMGIMSAVMILSVIIPLTLYLILRRHFVEGLLAGSIKG